MVSFRHIPSHSPPSVLTSSEFQAYFEELGDLRPYVPDFTAVLKDFSARSHEEIRGNLRLQAILLALRRILDRNLPAEFERFIGYIFRLNSEEGGLRLLELIVYYFTEATDKVPYMEMERVLASQGTAGENVMQTIAVELRREGRREGRMEGEKIGLREAVYDVLQARFGDVPAAVQEQLAEMHDLAALRQTAVQAALTDSLTAFETWLAGEVENQAE